MELTDIANIIREVREDLANENAHATRRTYTQEDCDEVTEEEILAELYLDTIRSEAIYSMVDNHREISLLIVPHICAMLRAYQRADLKGIIQAVFKLRNCVRTETDRYYEHDAVKRAAKDPEIS